MFETNKNSNEKEVQYLNEHCALI